MFPRERDLQKFVEACMGMGPFRDLRVFQDGRRAVGREYHLPDGQRVDLLCEERTKRGLGRLVAIELKRENEQGTVEQVIRYIKALRTLFAPRKVRGLIITAHEDLDAASSLKGALLDGYEIEWHCYRVDFKEAGHGD
ncbi:MAG: endonuclease NucS domain-containing protein [Vicinamibacteria bacterium]